MNNDFLQSLRLKHMAIFIDIRIAQSRIMLQKSVKASMQDWFLMRCLMKIIASKYCFFFSAQTSFFRECVVMS